MPLEVVVDLLFLKPLETGVSYAIIDHKVIGPNFLRHLGLRGKIGIPLPHDEWNFSLEFLHYHARTRSYLKNGTFFSTWDGSLHTNKNYSSLWRLHLGIASFFLSRSVSLSSSFSLTPFIGGEYAEIRQKLGQNEFVSMKNKFWGGGPSLGLKGKWKWTDWFCLIGESSWNFLWGKMYVHQDIHSLNYLEEMRELLNELDLSLGLQIGRKEFYAGISFEILFFPHQNQLVRFPHIQNGGFKIGNQGDLALYGFGFTLGIEF